MKKLIIVFVRDVYFDLQHDRPLSLGENRWAARQSLLSAKQTLSQARAFILAGTGLDTSTNFTSIYLYYIIHILSTR